MVVEIATYIIKKDISNNIFNYIINIINLNKMKEKLCTICSQIGQRIVYFIFQKLLNYFYINKL